MNKPEFKLPDNLQQTASELVDAIDCFFEQFEALDPLNHMVLGANDEISVIVDKRDYVLYIDKGLESVEIEAYEVEELVRKLTEGLNALED